MANEIPRIVLSRRDALILGGGLVGGLMSPSAWSRPVVPGEDIFSEAVQLGGLSRDGKTGIRLRLCRYPDAGVAWVWVHAFTPDGAFNYCDNDRPSSTARTPLESDEARYVPQDERLLNFLRNGPRSKPESLTVDASVMAHATGEVRAGEGSVPLTIKASFTPKRSFVGLVDERSEIGGEVALKISAGGKVYEATMAGQMHEQPQTKPRFVEPFTYGSLWGAETGCTILRGPRGSRGYITKTGASPLVADSVDVTPPGPNRLVRLNFKDRDPITFECIRTHVFDQPVYGTVKPGSMIVSSIEGQPLSGGINDWRPETMTYWDGK